MRPTWDEYFVKIMLVASERGNCDRGRAGAIIVVENNIVATGYAGAPSGCKTCDEIGHEFRKTTKPDGSTSQHCVRTTHAEMNAIAQAAKRGASTRNGTIYCKMTPCLDCTKLLINAGITRVVAYRHYHAEGDSLKVLEESKVPISWVMDEIESYPKQE
jgi:dCMP deaminase